MLRCVLLLVFIGSVLIQGHPHGDRGGCGCPCSQKQGGLVRGVVGTAGGVVGKAVGRGCSAKKNIVGGVVSKTVGVVAGGGGCSCKKSAPVVGVVTPIVSVAVGRPRGPCTCGKKAPCACGKKAPPPCVKEVPCTCPKKAPCTCGKKPPCPCGKKPPCPCAKKAPCTCAKKAPCTCAKKAPCTCAKKAPCTCGIFLPALLSGETYNAYIRRVFTCQQGESEEVYFKRIFKQYEKEANADYIKRIDLIFLEFPQLKCRNNPDYFSLGEKYYKLKYGNINSLFPKQCEDEKEYYTRILKRYNQEDFNSYIRRLECAYRAYPSLVIWRKVQFDQDTQNWYIFRDVDYCSNIRPSLNIREKIEQIFARRKSEVNDDYTYFKRICARRSGECDKAYVDRLTKIKLAYKNLNLWYSKEYLELTRNYYSLLFRQRSKEDLNEYYRRLTLQCEGEDINLYVKRMSILESLFSNLPLWKNENYLQFTRKYYERIYSKQASEDVTKYLQRVTAKSCDEDVEEFGRRLNIVRWVCRDTDYFYNTKYLTFTKPYFEYYYRRGSETNEEWVRKIFTRCLEETDEQYLNRVNIVKSVQSQLADLDINREWVKYTADYYKLLYKRGTSEDVDSWIKRITIKDQFETVETYKTRLTYLSNVFTDCRSSVEKVLEDINKTFNEKRSLAEKTEVDLKSCGCKQKKQVVELSAPKTTACGCKKSLTEEDIKTVFAKKETEDILTYFTRITTKSSTTVDEYIKTLTTVRRCYPDLPLWYNVKYIDLVKNYYTSFYTKRSCETVEEQFKRIVTKESFETEELWAQRVEVIHNLFPTLPLWYDETYYESYTKSFYQTYYKKTTTEDITNYYLRITAKNTQESETVYIERLNLIKRTYCTLPLWYSDKYLDITSKYYTTKYTKFSTETEETLFKRIVTQEIGETNDLRVQRVEVVHRLFPNLPLWCQDTYYEKYTKSVYEVVYKKLESEEETTYFSRVTKQIEKETDSVYCDRITLVKRTYSNIPLWYSEKYVDLTTKYYTVKYTKTSSETEETFYSRIVKTEVGETDRLCAQRVEIIHGLFPNLPLWYSKTHFETYTRKIYTITYEKLSTETEIVYYNRIIKRISKESDIVYVSRLDLVETTYSTLPLWYSEKYFSIIKQLYTLKYIKQSGECEETYIKRLVAKEVCDTSTDIYAQRLHLVHLATVTSVVWYEAKYYEFTKSYYETFYKKLDCEACETWLAKVIAPLCDESKENTFKRITLIKKFSSGCGCWTVAAFDKLACSKTFSSEYIAEIKKAFIVVESYESKSSSSSTSTRVASGEESEESISYKRGC